MTTSEQLQASQPTGAPPLASAARRSQRSVPEQTALVAVLAVLCVYFSIASPYFFDWANFVNIFSAVAVTGIIAAPATLLLVSGQIDLSVGSAAAFAGAVLAKLAADGGGLTWPIVAALAACIGIGVANGLLTTVVGVSSLITTLGSMAVFRGLTEVVTDGQTIPVAHFGGLGTARPFLDLPVSVLLLVGVTIACWAAMRWSVFGRWMYAIGANPAAARLVGIPVKRALFLGFVLVGAAAGLAGLVIASQVGSAGPTAGSGLELSVLTAIVIGGASLSGGRGTIAGTVLGLLIIGVLNNGLVLLDVSSFWQDVARGALLIAAVSFDRLRALLSRSA